MSQGWFDRVPFIETELTSSLRKALSSLKTLWGDIGFDNGMCQERIDMMVQHLNNLLDQMVKEEEILKTKLLKDVEKHGQDLLRLSKELNQPPDEPPEGLSILDLEKDLRLKVERMSKERHERMKVMKRLRQSDQELCDMLCSTPYYIPSGSVPSRKDLDDLEKHVKVLETEKAERLSKFRKTRKDIVKLMEELDQNPETSFQQELVSDEDEGCFLSSENMKALASLHDQLEAQRKENEQEVAQLKSRAGQLWERLEVAEEERQEFLEKYTLPRSTTIHAFKEEILKCEQLMRENMEVVMKKTREELVKWWDKCYYSEQQRKEFTYFDDAGENEESLKILDEEVNKVKKFYEENEVMLSKVAKRQELFLEFLEFERKATDPARFFNRRGNNLLQEEKARKKLMKELPRVEEDLQELISEWEAFNGRDFLFGGMKFAAFIKKQWDDYKKQKEEEKSQRQQAKAKQTENEARFGSKVTMTPTKRRLQNTITPSRTPTKSRKLGETPTPGSASKLGTPRTNHTSIFSSPAFGSSTKPKPKLNTPKQHSSLTKKAVKERKVLGDMNSESESLFSQTAVSSQTSALTNASLASVGHYSEFTTDINQKEDQNFQSSLLRI